VKQRGTRCSRRTDHAIARFQFAPPVKWQLKVTSPNGNLQSDPAEVEDVWLVLGYQWG